MDHEVFINYRKGDGDQVAVIIEQYLSTRFGDAHVFRASKSIAPGERYPEKLLTRVRRSHVVLAMVGENWSRRAELHDENDWVRKEISEALSCAISVIPVLIGRKTERLDPAHLPADLKLLADHQSIRFDLHNTDADLERIGDLIARMVPSLKDANRPTEESRDGADVRNSVNEAHGTVVQGRDFTGDVGGTIIKDARGPVHAGRGDVNYNSPNISGPGGMYIAGDSRGGIHQNFGDSRKGKEDDR